MTVAQLIESLGFSGPVKMMVNSYVAIHLPGMLGKVVAVHVDRENEQLIVTLDREPFITKTFSEVEAFFIDKPSDDLAETTRPIEDDDNGPETLSGSTPEQPAGDSAQNPGDGGGGAPVIPGPTG